MTTSKLTSTSFNKFLQHKDQLIQVQDDNGFEGKELVITPPLIDSIPEVKTVKEQIRKKEQGKLLLVALLENYCMLYDQTKEQNQKLFLVLCQHLCRMGIIDSTDFLEEFSSVRSSYKRAFKELVVKAMDTVKRMDNRRLIGDSNTADSMDDVEVIHTVSQSPHLGRHPFLHMPVPSATDFTEHLEHGMLRFEEDFEVLNTLGKGAFGKVLHTKNKLDGCHYAVKIIKTPSSGGADLLKTLREVKLLAGITHSNIVGYFSSWLQYMDVEFCSDSEYEDSYDTMSKSNFQSEMDSYNSSNVEFKNDSMNSKANSKSSRTSKSSKPSDPSVVSASLHSYHEEGAIKDLGLFIQMELCEFTLHDWLESLNTTPLCEPYRRLEEKILHCFVDLLKGVQFIHKKNCIHRDLKPKNIYWKPEPEYENGSITNLGGRNGKWKIGDFGLATISHSQEKLNMQQLHSLGVGTITYASPEQLRPGNDHESYSFETDIYSLGIILFELLVPFGTGMERIEKLTHLRNSVISDDFLASRPKEAALILWMMSPDPKLRPSISDIFKLEWFTSVVQPDGSDASPTTRIASLESELQKANEQVRQKTEENGQLKLRITELEQMLATKNVI
ncbi:Eukaryotic translation initiation factor 2-alpha kinase [Boothiomyces sp. JEL0838]|nr:Eukaryotic translation initiation factor 2-alpha kinase [Boothiomyces sp. JEL0838]